MDKKIRIALDGPSGSGKSTIAKKLSSKLNILYLSYPSYIPLVRGEPKPSPLFQLPVRRWQPK